MRRTCDGRCKDGRPCKGPAVTGSDKCRMHLGKKAGPVIVEARARELFGKVVPDVVPVDNPLAAYAEFAGEVMAWKDLMATLLEDLRTLDVTTSSQGEQTRATVQAYERAMDRANTVLSSYARLRIDDRLAAISKQQANTVMRAIEAVITLLGADREQAAEARAVAAGHLRAVA